MQFIWLLLLLLLSLPSCRENHYSLTNTVSPILQVIPEKDRQELDAFFQLLLHQDSFAYTLFGSKPMSVCCYISKPILFTLYHPKESLALEKGWETWKRYFPYFPSDHFVLKRLNFKNRLGRSIYLIHKKHALQVIKNYLGIFQKVLGHSIDPKQLVERLCDPNEDIDETLQEHTNLLGILFGYGKANAMDYERETDICEYLSKKMLPPFSHCKEIEDLSPNSRVFVNSRNEKMLPLFSNDQETPDSRVNSHNGKMNLLSKPCVPSPQYSSLAEELNDICSGRTRFELNDWILSKIASPVFISKKQDPETEDLRKDYTATMKKLRKVYREKPFLEVTLTQWMDPK